MVVVVGILNAAGGAVVVGVISLLLVATVGYIDRSRETASNVAMLATTSIILW